jgi:hypothetical protein
MRKSSRDRIRVGGSSTAALFRVHIDPESDRLAASPMPSATTGCSPAAMPNPTTAAEGSQTQLVLNCVNTYLY